MRREFRIGFALALGLALMAGCSDDGGGVSPEAQIITEYLDTYIEEHLAVDGRVSR